MSLRSSSFQLQWFCLLRSLAESDLMVGAAGKVIKDTIKLSCCSKSVNHVLHKEQDYDNVSKQAGVVGHCELK